jgi:hypothetical protein
MSDTDPDTLELTNTYRYDGEQTAAIPYIYRKDLGGAVLVKCPDGSTRIFSKDEVCR